MTSAPKTAEAVSQIPEDVQALAKRFAVHFLGEPWVRSTSEHNIAQAILADRASRPSPSAIEGGSSGLTRGTAQRAERYVRHKKRGTTYRVLGEGEVQVSHPHTLTDVAEGDTLVVYQAGDGKLWLRFPVEFNDGRFEDVLAPDLPDPDADPKAVDAVARSIEPDLIREIATTLVPFSYGAFELQRDGAGNRVQPARQPNAHALKAANAIANLLRSSIEPGKDEERLREAAESAAIDLECIATAIRHGFEAQAAVDADMSAARLRAALSPSRGEADTSQDRAAAIPTIAQTDAGVGR